MLRLLLALCVVAQVSLAQQITNTTQPWFCRNGPCPAYELLKTQPNYEIRLYGSTQWIQSNGTGSNYTAAFTNSFSPLFRYLQAGNSENVVILSGGIDLQLVNISGNVTNVTSSFILSPAQLNGSTTPPQPLNKNLSFYNGYNGTFAVASFGGFATQALIVEQSTALAGNLTADNLTFSPQIYFGIYDDPARLVNRHNEVWYLLTDYNTTAGSALEAG